MATELAPAPAPAGLTVVRPRRQSTAAWPMIDRVGYWLCWATGIALCLIAIAIVRAIFTLDVGRQRNVSNRIDGSVDVLAARRAKLDRPTTAKVRINEDPPG